MHTIHGRCAATAQLVYVRLVPGPTPCGCVIRIRLLIQLPPSNSRSNLDSKSKSLLSFIAKLYDHWTRYTCKGSVRIKLF